MVEFNPDGSIKMPSGMTTTSQEKKERLENSKSIAITREVVYTKAPKKCILHIEVSKKFDQTEFIKSIFNFGTEGNETPMKLIQKDTHEFKVEVGTAFRRCQECVKLSNRYREALQGCMVLDKGNCTFEGLQKTWTFEDYFG